MSTFNFLNGTLRLCGTDIVCANFASGISITGFPPLTGTVTLVGSGDISLSQSGNTIIIAGGSGATPQTETFTTGILSGFSTMVFNHNKNSLELTPKLYVRSVGTNNWMRPDYIYNDSFFEKDYTNYGIYNFKTGVAIGGWSGANLNRCDFFGFSGGKILCITNFDAEILSTNQVITAPLLVKPYVGDFDMWCQLTGDYLNSTNANGIVAFSLNESGSVRKSFSTIDNTSGGARYKYRNINGNNITSTPRPKASFLRMKRVDNISTLYTKSGVNQGWIPLTDLPTGKAVFIDNITDSIYLGVHVTTASTSPVGTSYTWDFFKSWSSIELRASGTNNILIINNEGNLQEVKVIV